MASGFQTDVDISGNRNIRSRELQPWVPEADSAVDGSLESAGPVVWDQFETNQRLFGTTSTYDESHYTTQIDRSAPSYKMREERARRIAQEIEGKIGDTAHMREERGQISEADGEDEEDKYSGVRREPARPYAPLPTGTPNSYTPPARRPPSSQPTVPGAPVDPAIVSSQLSRPDGVKVAIPKPLPKQPDAKLDETKPVQSSTEPSVQHAGTTDQSPIKNETSSIESLPLKVQEPKPTPINTSVSPHRHAIPENPTEDVETKVLEKFRQFATAEKLKLTERKRAQATQDRTAKLNELKRFSDNFKLKTPVPVDLVGILAKDPAKQERIMEKAKREHEELTTVATTKDMSAPESLKPVRDTLPPVSKFDRSTIPAPLVDRQTFLNQKNRERLPVAAARGERLSQQPAPLPARGAPLFSPRSAGVNQDRKQIPPQSIPAPIPLAENRMPPTAPIADQSNLSSPQRSALHTPTSTVSTKFNAKALEFRPNVNAPIFNPASSNPPSSPASAQRASSVSRTATPSSFFVNRKPLSPGDRPSITDHFNPITRMKLEEERKREKESGKDSDIHKDFTSNGGIPYAYMTGPRWNVKTENSERSYVQFFEKPSVPVPSPHQSRSNSTQHIPYHHQVPAHLQNGQHGIPQISTPQFPPTQTVQNHHFPHYDETHRMSLPVSASTPQYASPRMQPGQMGFPSPMAHPAQVAYGPMPQYFGAQPGQTPIPMRQFSGPQYIHSPATQISTPVMMPQAAGGAYIAVPAQFHQMPMNSPGANYAFPQQNGYPSPGRGASMMTHQGSQQGHPGGQPMMYTISQQGQMAGYGPQGGQMAGIRPGYVAQGPYGSGPMQPHHYQQRAMSSGYTGKMMQHMPPNHPPPNVQQPSPYGHGEA